MESIQLQYTFVCQTVLFFIFLQAYASSIIFDLE